MRVKFLPRATLLLLLFSGALGSDLYPPGLLPLINRANALLSAGQFNEAAKAYTEAIEQSPADYLLYYKRATAHFSQSRHGPALDDFEKVLSLTGNMFDNAHLMKARIHLKDGHFADARAALGMYKGKDGAELAQDIEEGEKTAKKATQERKAQLWNACIETSSAALRIASHSLEIRTMRAECALAAGDIESAAGDLTRITHLIQPPSTEFLVRVFRLSYFLLQESESTMAPIKQCLFYDPDSKQCLSLHRLVKGLEKGFSTLDELLGNEDWRGVIKLLTSSGKTNDLLNRFEDALNTNTAREQLLGPNSDSAISLPNAKKSSPRRKVLLRALCKSYIASNLPRKAEPFCEDLLRMVGSEEDVDGLVGRAENLLIKEEFEEAVRVLEKAFEASGRGSRDIHGRLQKAQRLLKQSRQKDYYKVLGVSRDADEKTIKKAYRAAAKTAHPDKGGSEAKMAAVNEAYEVLSDPELRQRYDMGDDPNDPMSGHGGPGGAWTGSGHPFAQFFQSGGSQFFQQQAGGGGSRFQFHFGGH